MVRSRLTLKVPPNMRLQKTCETLLEREPCMPGTLKGNNICLNYNRLQASQNADVNVTKSDTVSINPVLHDQNVLQRLNLALMNLALM